MPGAVKRPSPSPRLTVISGAIRISGLGAGLASLYRQSLPALQMRITMRLQTKPGQETAACTADSANFCP